MDDRSTTSYEIERAVAELRAILHGEPGPIADGAEAIVDLARAVVVTGLPSSSQVDWGDIQRTRRHLRFSAKAPAAIYGYNGPDGGSTVHMDSAFAQAIVRTFGLR